jgi:hypothetical protein
VLYRFVRHGKSIQRDIALTENADPTTDTCLLPQVEDTARETYQRRFEHILQDIVGDGSAGLETIAGAPGRGDGAKDGGLAG